MLPLEHSFRQYIILLTVQTIFQLSTWKVLFFPTDVFIIKNLTNFRETRETGMHPRLNDLINFAVNVACPFHGVSHY